MAMILSEFFAPDKVLLGHRMLGVGIPPRFDPGYDPADPKTISEQADRDIQQGLDGWIFDYYGPEKDHQEDAALTWLHACEQRQKSFALCLDKGIYSGKSSDAEKQFALERTMFYAVHVYLKSKAYLRIDGRPVVFVFPDASLVDWGKIKSFNSSILLLTNSANAGFVGGTWDGAYPWIVPNGGKWDGNIGEQRLKEFYAARTVNRLCFGVAYPGFNDAHPKDPTKQVWDITKPVRQMPRNRVGTFAMTAGLVPDDVKYVQIATINDFDERTDVEFGIESSKNQ
jgi:hypothetical protein